MSRTGGKRGQNRQKGKYTDINAGHVIVICEYIINRMYLPNMSSSARTYDLTPVSVFIVSADD